MNSQNWVRIDSVPQLASELGKPKSSPKNKDVDLEHPQQVQLNPDQAKGVKSSLLQEGSSPTFTHAETMKTSVTEDCVLPPSTGFFAHRKKAVFGVALLVLFCITAWLVAGHAWNVVPQALEASNKTLLVSNSSEYQVKIAYGVGRQTGFDGEKSRAILEIASQLGEDLGLYGAAGISMGKNAMSRVAISRELGAPMTIEQGLSQQKDIMSKASKNSSVQAYAVLKLAVNHEVLPADNPNVKNIFDAFERGEDVSFETASNLIFSTGAKLSTFTSSQGISQGMSLLDVADNIMAFYSANERVSLYGSVKRRLEAGGSQGGLDIEKFAEGLRANSMTAKALNITEKEAKRLNGLDFASAYNKLNSQKARSAALATLNIVGKDAALIKSILGDRISSFGVAGDKGDSRIAGVLLEEEKQRRDNGGITNAEVNACSLRSIQELLSK